MKRELNINRPIFLTGFMGTGKSSVGIRLADVLGLPFVDLDSLIVEQLKSSIDEIFMNDGEAKFRSVEKELLESLLLDAEPRVIALGGGALIDDAIRKQVRSKGVLICFKANPNQIAERLTYSQLVSLFIMCEKPIQNINDKEFVLETIRELYQKRENIYNDCDFAVITGSREIADVIDEILKNLETILA